MPSNHLISSTTYIPSPIQHQPLQLPTTIRAVIDSGASHTMSSSTELFEDITYFPQDANQPTAIMGDDTTSLKIQGYGIINIIVQEHRLRLLAYYVPKLGTTLISAKQHMKSKGCYFHAEAGKTTLAFPNFFIHPRISTEIDVHMIPAHEYSHDHSHDTPGGSPTRRLGPMAAPL